MVDATVVEQAAMRHCLKFLGEVAAEIGFDKPLGLYSEAQALQVVDAIVTGYTQAMVQHHEQDRHPSIQGLEVTELDPIRIDVWASDLALEQAPPVPAMSSGPPAVTPPLPSSASLPKTAFDDMPSDMPWEEAHA